jgi:hypothetical protein
MLQVNFGEVVEDGFLGEGLPMNIKKGLYGYRSYPYNPEILVPKKRLELSRGYPH